MSRKKKHKNNPENNHSPKDIPAAFLDRLSKIIGREDDKATDDSAARKSGINCGEPIWQTIRETFFQPKDSSFRINALHGVRSFSEIGQAVQSLGFPTQAIDWCPGAYWVDSSNRDALIGSSLFEESLIYIQNPSSMFASLVLNPKPEESVLDLAAAPGGKTLHLISLMDNAGLVSAVEVVRGRFFKLQANLKRYGARIVKTYLTDGRTVGRKTPARFDKVLLDAPCSGEARIHHSDPASWQYWKPRKIKEQARKQFGLIRSAFEALKPGGTMVYCTCSFAPEENEAVVSDFVKQFESAEIQSVLPAFPNHQTGVTQFEEKNYHPAVSKTIRILPTRLMDGFFIAKIRKAE